MPTNYTEVARHKKPSVWDDYDDDLIELTKTKKLFIEIPALLHIDIKKRSASRGITIKKYVLRAIVDRIKKEQLELGECDGKN